MSRRGKAGRAPLPLRDGVNPVRVRMVSGVCSPAVDPRTVLEFLIARLPTVDPAEIRDRMTAGQLVDDDGSAIAPDDPFRPGVSIWFHRDLPAEPRVPFEIDILHRDERLLIVDKPHFLSSTPGGRHVAESVVVRLRRELGLPDLVAVHRLDRLTAGVLMLVIDPAARGAYQQLFQNRRIAKEYEAIAPLAAGDPVPVERWSRLEKDPRGLQMLEVPGEPNAGTRIEPIAPLDAECGIARYRLTPWTGKMHQLRVHMNALGIPILGDPLYPVVRQVAPDDYSAPLHLLARSLEFRDPLTGRSRRFESRRRLAAGIEEGLQRKPAGGLKQSAGALRLIQGSPDAHPSGRTFGQQL